MKYQSPKHLAQARQFVASPVSVEPMSFSQRRNRWISLLESLGDRDLRPLHEVEYLPRRERYTVRRDNSAISIAFADPVLREDGLAGDSYGDAKRYFGLTDRQLHMVLCSCHSGAIMSARVTAQRLRACRPARDRASLIGRMIRAIAGGG